MQNSPGPKPGALLFSKFPPPYRGIYFRLTRSYFLLAEFIAEIAFKLLG